MATIELTEKTFENTVLDGDIVLVDFWAAWCGPCQAFGPVFEASSEKHPDITFAKVDTDAEQGLSAALNIRSIPTLMAFRDGIGVFAQAGALPGHVLEDLISQIRALDMDEVRDRIAAADATPSAT
ncbi:thioredoxin [Protaetiibacter intestinalis]|uniref:Thioredoxin n=1 Tax=Protaetiibacter intestinalis TaxID=2419774 RepID=A0A387B348_9MICO|nr:thioredoxin [Protaetiibacter intestinalis]AYF96833.1 thioredoxin [Protaetiibacter intestinalis]